MSKRPNNDLLDVVENKLKKFADIFDDPLLDVADQDEPEEEKDLNATSGIIYSSYFLVSCSLDIKGLIK